MKPNYQKATSWLFAKRGGLECGKLQPVVRAVTKRDRAQFGINKDKPSQ